MGDKWATERRPLLCKMLSTTDSPVEAGLIWALICHGGPEAYTFGPGREWEMRPQVEVKTPGRTYRVDIAVKRGQFKVAIEVDGHAYHHASDDQEAYDACRDWALGQVGWVVLRVPAWRVLQSPTSCAEEVAQDLRQVEAQARRPAVKPVEEESEEEFAVREAKFNECIRECEAAGHADGASANRAKLERMRKLRENSKIVKALRACELRSDDTGTEALLKEVQRRARERSGLDKGAT